MQWLRHLILLSFIATFGQSTTQANDAYEDMLLHKIIEAYRLAPLEPISPVLGPKEILGRALFFDPILSGSRSIACATCHIRSIGSGDGLPLAIGLGAKGIGIERLHDKNAFVIPRNTLPLFNRGAAIFKDFFWDGRVQFGREGKYESPLGKNLPEGFDSLLAVACVLPIAEPDEMLGYSKHKIANINSVQHGDLVTLEGIDNNYQIRTLNAFGNLVQRLLASETDEGKIYQTMFQSAYPSVALKDIQISHVGNALAAYIRKAFALNPAAWDYYLQGDDNALTPDQKKGAIIFFGKGRCAVCHSGIHFTDFLFHSLSIPQRHVGKHSSYLDYGRAAASGRAKDRFLFRTPPLRNVTITGPWGHNGIFSNLEDIIEHHFNPVPLLYQVQQSDINQKMYVGRLLTSRDKLLGEISLLSRKDIQSLLAFLRALASPTILDHHVAIPSNVPSGKNNFIPMKTDAND